MVLEKIYVVRHGFRSNWVVDPNTGTYSSNITSPTGIPSDPALASYGVKQAEQLGEHLSNLQPPVDIIFSSPFYRCIQTLVPFTTSEAARDKAQSLKAGNHTSETKVRVNIEPGLGEFYGLARFDHPSPATLKVLNTHFPNLQATENPIIVPSTKGESIPQLHDRIAYCLHSLIATIDAMPDGPKALLICTHAASMIAIGRALTGRMPDDECEEDFKCFTCSFSQFSRKEGGKMAGVADDSLSVSEAVEKWDPNNADEVPDIGWRNKGIQGGWKIEVNGDCSFLENGEERGWDFSIEERTAMEEAARVLLELAAGVSTPGSKDEEVGGEEELEAEEEEAESEELKEGEYIW
ncbi:C6 zinc cluster transcription factor-like protein [Recurvomyces mirabilis]|uniref:C6 zinc cluster transcription factor-like protein n=1 Tax=Recurvomyces mirabilis TaxID=574656 RepID=A0AAE1C5E4_9PEZI|nr:C6 zinc cluster transcription factor-like protein [Recurvomyces mirabilis]KAK5161192.1 C6 zinc cluster transcription factor-like protein [Recurvomyces mirabilis]